MRAVLDTNILISAFITRQGLPFQAVKLWLEGDYDLVTSHWQIEEFRSTSRYERVRKKVNRAEIGTFVNALRDNALVITELPSVDLSPDPDDNFILATAFAGAAQYLVSGDKNHLQSLGRVQSISVLTVRDFLNLF